MSKQIQLFVAFGVVLTYSIAVYWFGLGGVQNELLKNIAYLVAPIFAVVAGVYTLTIYGLKGAASRSFAFLVLGLCLWALGEGLWVYYDFILKVTPYPSMADFFYLLAYPAFFLGLVEHVRSSGVKWKKFDPVIVFLFAIIVVLLAGVATYFGIFLAYDASASQLENGVAIGYGLADVAIILYSLLVLILAWEFKGGSLMRFYLYCFFAFTLTLIADFGFAIYNDEYLASVWLVKNSLDTLWILQYLCFGLGFFSFGLSLSAAQQRLLQNSKQRG